MKAIRIHQFGSELHLDDIATPEPRSGEMLIRIRAASVNPVDGKIRAGKYPAVNSEMLPYVLGRDMAGTVERVGPDVGGFKIGDSVFAFLDIARGGYADHVIATPVETVPIPRSLDQVVAAAVPLAGITAWQGLFDYGRLVGGQRVLIHGGAGGVGHFAIQFAKAYGAWVATTVSRQDREFAGELGADLVIDYKEERFEDKVRDIDLVYDLIAGETQDRSWQVLKKGGALVSTLTQPPEDKSKAHGVRGLRYTAQPNANELAEIGRLIDEGKVKVTIAKTFPLTEARAAQDYLDTEHVRGKVVLIVA
jgi:NADPH:quinone reductase-like Zn-dependent oxidoreductase